MWFSVGTIPSSSSLDTFDNLTNITMRNLFLLSTTLVLVVFSATTTQAKPNKNNDNFLGPIISFIDGQAIAGIGGKFRITDNVSVRPSYNFANLSGSGVSVGGGSATYEFDVQDTSFRAFAGAGVNFYSISTGGKPESSMAPFAQIGIDLQADENISITADVKIPVGAAPLGTVLSVGGGYRF